MLALTVETPGRRFPMLWETKRIAPGQSNTWYFEALGMDGGVRFSTRSPQVLQRFGILDGEQAWSEVQPGHRSVWPTVTGGIFEFGFPDALLQMWADVPGRARRSAGRPVRHGDPARGPRRAPRVRGRPAVARDRPERAGRRLTSRDRSQARVSRRRGRRRRAGAARPAPRRDDPRTALLPRSPAPGRPAPAALGEGRGQVPGEGVARGGGVDDGDRSGRVRGGVLRPGPGTAPRGARA